MTTILQTIKVILLTIVVGMLAISILSILAISAYMALDLFTRS